jgi:hypothetical protein
LGDHGTGPNHGDAAQLDKLVDAAKPPNDNAVMDRYVPSEGSAICYHAAIANVRVVTNMGVCHKEVLITY